ncbi:N-acetylmuramoyl-L-alanine amidase [Dysgonomonas sp. 511]|uniref:N-acetylmuramoyl-L-alanine amidase family protein n=1 Tax=Dysgonomonas sp. 511 TaxID=2302930 RepID=UPI0013D6267C|nr:N-acetylmuramoyl-L-alanine amidase [Dysgonomonas sp. 511]NDV79853.1 N-acetylmuramoyl-L-alanine amidase [Dysgonomonas sp. 511]
MKKFLFLLFSLWLACGLAIAGEQPFTIVIDAGHGGKDGGAARGRYEEKNINLAVALALGEMIEKNLKDVKVIYTRKKDVFVALSKRAQIANKAKASLFISIHANATKKTSITASGAETYILGGDDSDESLEVAKKENSVILLEDDHTTTYEGFDPESTESYILFGLMTNIHMKQSLRLAELLQSDFKKVAKRNDRGVKQAGLLVLRRTSMPGVLVELGYINNPQEAKFLNSKQGQQLLASAIYSGLKKYKEEYDRKDSGFSYTPSSAKVSETSPSSASIGVARTDATSARIEYRVQFLTSSKVLPDNSRQFKGLSPVSYYKEGGMVKYTYGSATNPEEIEKTKKMVKTKFKDAFVVTFKDGLRIK